MQFNRRFGRHSERSQTLVREAIMELPTGVWNGRETSRRRSMTALREPPTCPPPPKSSAKPEPAARPEPPPAGRPARGAPKPRAPRPPFSPGAAPRPPFPPGSVPRPPLPPRAAPPRPAAPAAPAAAPRHPPEHQAELLRDGLFACWLAVSINLEGEFGQAGCRQFLEGVLREAGDPQDPVEARLVRQLALADLRVVQLHAQAGRAQTLEAAELFNAAAVRLMAEFRRGALALAQYREMARGGGRRPGGTSGPACGAAPAPGANGTAAAHPAPEEKSA